MIEPQDWWPKCEWTGRYRNCNGVWSTSCGHVWISENSSPKRYAFCPYCGSSLVVKEPEE